MKFYSYLFATALLLSVSPLKAMENPYDTDEGYSERLAVGNFGQGTLEYMSHYPAAASMGELYKASGAAPMGIPQKSSQFTFAAPMGVPQISKGPSAAPMPGQNGMQNQ